MRNEKKEHPTWKDIYQSNPKWRKYYEEELRMYNKLSPVTKNIKIEALREYMVENPDNPPYRDLLDAIQRDSNKKISDIKLKLPKHSLLRVTIIISICSMAFSFFMGILGLVPGIILGTLIYLGIGAILGTRYWNKCRKVYSQFLSKGLKEKEALLKISKRTYPNFTENAHIRIIEKFNDIDLLVNFYAGAALKSDDSEERVLKILEHTSVHHFGGDKYKTITDPKAFD